MYIFHFKASQWPTGKVLGGTSRINFNIHLRGHITSDFLSWQSSTQDWSKEDVLYYFKKYEKVGTSFGKHILVFKNIQFKI